MKEQKKTVFLPTELYSKIKERVKATDFSSVDEYVKCVLEEVINEEEGTTLCPLSSKNRKNLSRIS